MSEKPQQDSKTARQVCFQKILETISSASSAKVVLIWATKTKSSKTTLFFG